MVYTWKVTLRGEWATVVAYAEGVTGADAADVVRVGLAEADGWDLSRFVVDSAERVGSAS